MKTDYLSLYFRKLRMLYCSELQLISYLPELAAHARSTTTKAALAVAVSQSRLRRDTLELLAVTHGIASAGDDCDSMRRLIGESRDALRSSAWHFPGDEDLLAISAALHRLQILNYGVARSLAAKTRNPNDVLCLEDLLGDLLDRYPEACEAPVHTGLALR